MFRIIARLKDEGVTMLLVEQFAAAALNVADYGYVLENGRISVHGSADKLKHDPAVVAAYLGGSHCPKRCAPGATADRRSRLRGSPPQALRAPLRALRTGKAGSAWPRWDGLAGLGRVCFIEAHLFALTCMLRVQGRIPCGIRPFVVAALRRS